MRDQAGGGGRDLLIVEDNRQNLELVQFLLEEVGHHVARPATRGGSRRARTPGAGPGADGHALPAPTASSWWPSCAATAVSATCRSSPSPPMRCAATASASSPAGCDGYIAKPIDVATFALQVEALMPAPRPAPGAAAAEPE